jgi:energy-coupling factor transporter ATP-binding protein EcfA2
VLAQVQLTDVRERRVSQYSLGMRWRLGIAIALLVRPRFIVLDEPTNGLDPLGIREMRGLIRSLAGAGVTIMISSHQLSEIAQICDRVGVLVAGRTRYEGETAGLAVDGDLEAGFFRIIETVGGGVRFVPALMSLTGTRDRPAPMGQQASGIFPAPHWNDISTRRCPRPACRLSTHSPARARSSSGFSSRG